MTRFRHHLGEARALCLVLDNDTPDMMHSPDLPLYRYVPPEHVLRTTVAPLREAGWDVVWIRPLPGFKDFDDLRLARGPYGVRMSIEWHGALPPPLGESDANDEEVPAWPLSAEEFARVAFHADPPPPRDEENGEEPL